jgi:hypothetical protein
MPVSEWTRAVCGLSSNPVPEAALASGSLSRMNAGHRRGTGLGKTFDPKKMLFLEPARGEHAANLI